MKIETLRPMFWLKVVTPKTIIPPETKAEIAPAFKAFALGLFEQVEKRIEELEKRVASRLEPKHVANRIDHNSIISSKPKPPTSRKTKPHPESRRIQSAIYFFRSPSIQYSDEQAPSDQLSYLPFSSVLRGEVTAICV